MNTTVTYLIAVLSALAIAASCNLDGPDDISAAADQSAELATLQAAAPGSTHQLTAASALCQKERGAGAQVLWLADGSLVCRAAPPVSLPTTLALGAAQ